MMERARTLLGYLRQCQAGSMAIETAIIAPVLIGLSIGGFEIGSIVARQTELQSSAAEAAAIVRAASPETSEELIAIRDVVAESSKVPTSNVSVVEIYRCADSSAYVTTSTSCGAGTVVNRFIRLAITDTYYPMWSEFGIGSSMSFDVTRVIQIG